MFSAVRFTSDKRIMSMTHASQCLPFCCYLHDHRRRRVLTAFFRSSGFLAILALSFAMAADAESSTAIEIHLQNLEGRLEPLNVTSPKATLEELQEPILQLFGKIFLRRRGFH